ncbi:carboxymuconolactone decarboxylase family protein [Amycolatopsis sp. FDAARGOS 1241]|uniref:carboxymuconolactone decarboxylase family protein n=1 Tax=Amycolatopsis sp. FDAARGOS 1241 TaxID=2778070 RepID=UPI00194FAEFF|nr:carboxymuconolactone decarboxylase family protein [Amycolatopsis sp. FDAARGOS 1241]QRP48526.1 carboxymuconolactone decarboxylase family protein [Amycolatopsis sp. FDAARGOS 1241]
MARLDYADADSEVADRIRARRGGRLTPLDRMLLHSPPFADGWNNLLGAIRKQGVLPGALRELAILRVAELNGAEYEWTAHAPVAEAEGLAPERIAALRRSGDPSVLDEAQQAVLAYTDAMTKRIAVPDKVFLALQKHFGDQEIVELTVTIGAYNLVSRFLVALEVGS